MTAQTLRQENLAFAGTCGVSRNGRRHRFLPAFRDEETGRVELARFANGKLAPAHLILGLPADWVTERAADGSVLALKASIVAGFVREERFYTREEAAAFS